MIGECFSCPFYCFLRCFGNLYGFCWQWFPCWGVVPVNVGTIAALIGATKATPNQEGASRNVEAISINDPIFCIFHRVIFLYLSGLSRSMYPASLMLSS